jgi:plastocyanin
MRTVVVTVLGTILLSLSAASAQTTCRTGNCATGTAPAACANRAAPYTVRVTAANFSFSPRTPKIEPGDCVLWENVSVTTHSNAFDSCTDDTVGNSCQSPPNPSCRWDSGNLTTGAPRATCFYGVTAFPVADYGFYCRQHDAPNHSGTMNGTLRVTTPILIDVDKSGSDIVVSWAGGGVPGDVTFKLLKSTDPLFPTAATTTLPAVGSAASPFTDTGEAGSNQLRFYLVRNKQTSES